MPTKDYEMPRFGLPAERIHPWLIEAVQECNAWLKAQPPTGDWDSVRQLLSATDGTDKVEGLSNVGYNKAKRVARELVASLANFKHEGEFTVAWDQGKFDTAAMLTNLDHNWADVTHANLPHRAALQYAVGFGTGYLYETWTSITGRPAKGTSNCSRWRPATSPSSSCPRITTFSAPTWSS